LSAGGRVGAAAVREELRRSDNGMSLTEVTVAPVDLAQYDALLEGKEADDGERTEREGDVGELPEGPASADVPRQLRGTGPAGAAGRIELRALPAGAGRAGSAGTAGQAHRASAPPVAVALGQELVGPGPEALSAEGAPASPAAAGGLVRPAA